jgi:hypothetical protein
MSQKDQRQHQAEALLARLQRLHEVLKHHQPLAEEGIETALAQAHPEEEPWLIRLALHLHLGGDAYLQALSHGGPRHNLQGQPRGEVDTAARHHARMLLRHRLTHRGKQPALDR